MTITEVLYLAAAVMLAAGTICAVVRIVRGPTILDRMIASDVLLTSLIIMIGIEMVINRHTQTLPVMLALAATAMFATIAVARYVSNQDQGAEQQAPEEVRDDV